MPHIRQFFPLSVLFFGLMFSTAFGKPADDHPPAASTSVLIGYFAPELYAAQTTIMQGFISSAQKKGWPVQVANANGDSQVQENQIRHFVQQGITTIVAVPVDSKGISPLVKELRAKGIRFFTIDRAPEGCLVDFCVMSDNFLAGVQSGQAMIELLEKKCGQPRGTLLELQGNLRQTVAQQRGKGFHSIIDRYPEIKVVSRETEWLPEKAQLALSEVMASYSIDGIFMHSDGAATSVVLRHLQQGKRLFPSSNAKHILLAGIDGSPETLAGIRDGFIDQSSSQPIPDFGILADYIEKIRNGTVIEPGKVVQEGMLWSPAEIIRTDIGPVLLLPTVSVTSQNVDDPRLWGNRKETPCPVKGH